jgi:phosphopantothenoylcysteine decarboxylase/phosphopantothenate--cysteine ligase
MLLRMGGDAIVINDVSGEGAGFDVDTNAATFLTLSTSIELPQMPKRKLADRILDEILTLRRPSSMLLELDEQPDAKSRQDSVLRESIPVSVARRQLIVE